MKKLLLTLVLLVGMFFGAFAQKLTYQAVIRDNNQQLVVNTDVKAFVTIAFSTGTPATYKDTVEGSTNINGLLSIEFGDESLAARDWTNATIVVKVVKANDESIVYVNEVPRPVSAVPYALSVNGTAIQQFLTEHNYVDQAEMNNRHYLTSDSAVIKTMQEGIAANASNISTTISKEKTDSATLAGRINTLETASMDCDDVKNCIKDTLSKYTTTDNLCNVINTCDLSSNTSIQELLQNLSNRIDEQNEVIGKLNRALDSVSQLIPFVCGASLVVDHEGNKYKTVEITTTSGKQCWMAENMRCTTAPAESGVTLVAGGYSSTDYSTPRYFPAGTEQTENMDSATYVNMYGILYNFPAAMAINTQGTSFEENHRGICPEGWHMPTQAEFNSLIGTANWNANTAFNPLLAGYFNQYHSKITDIGVGYYFWSGTPFDSINAYSLFSDGQEPEVDDFFYRSTVFSVRCLRNN